MVKVLGAPFQLLLKQIEEATLVFYRICFLAYFLDIFKLLMYYLQYIILIT